MNRASLDRLYSCHDSLWAVEGAWRELAMGMCSQVGMRRVWCKRSLDAPSGKLWSSRIYYSQWGEIRCRSLVTTGKPGRGSARGSLGVHVAVAAWCSSERVSPLIETREIASAPHAWLGQKGKPYLRGMHLAGHVAWLPTGMCASQRSPLQVHMYDSAFSAAEMHQTKPRDNDGCTRPHEVHEVYCTKSYIDGNCTRKLAICCAHAARGVSSTDQDHCFGFVRTGGLHDIQSPAIPLCPAANDGVLVSEVSIVSALGVCVLVCPALKT